MIDQTLKYLQASNDLIAQRKKITEQALIIAQQRKDLDFLRAQIEFLELKILRLTAPPVRMVG